MSTSTTPGAALSDGPPDRSTGAAAPPSRLAFLSHARDYAVLMTVVLIFVMLSITAPPFLTQRNLLNLLEQYAGIGIIAIAGTMLLISGGFDLSVGAIFALSGVTAALMANAVAPWLGMLLGVLAGTLAGLFNGLLTTRLKINAFIVTLASSIMIRGLALVVSGATLINVRDAAFRSFGNGDLVGLRFPAWMWLLFALFASFVLARTTLGRYIYASGGNEEAARLSGIRVDQLRTGMFMLSGLAAGLAGALSASRVGTGQADAGMGLELTAIAGVVVGGTSIWGGEGAVWRTMVGVILLALIGNGFNLIGVDPVYQQIVFGLIILAAAAVDARLRRGRI